MQPPATTTFSGLYPLPDQPLSSFSAVNDTRNKQISVLLEQAAEHVKDGHVDEAEKIYQCLIATAFQCHERGEKVTTRHIYEALLKAAVEFKKLNQTIGKQIEFALLEAALDQILLAGTPQENKPIQKAKAIYSAFHDFIKEDHEIFYCTEEAEFFYSQLFGSHRFASIKDFPFYTSDNIQKYMKIEGYNKRKVILCYWALTLLNNHNTKNWQYHLHQTTTSLAAEKLSLSAKRGYCFAQEKWQNEEDTFNKNYYLLSLLYKQGNVYVPDATKAKRYLNLAKQNNCPHAKADDKFLQTRQAEAEFQALPTWRKIFNKDIAKQAINAYDEVSHGQHVRAAELLSLILAAEIGETNALRGLNKTCSNMVYSVEDLTQYFNMDITNVINFLHRIRGVKVEYHEAGRSGKVESHNVPYLLGCIYDPSLKIHSETLPGTIKERYVQAMKFYYEARQEGNQFAEKSRETLLTWFNSQETKPLNDATQAKPPIPAETLPQIVTPGDISMEIDNQSAKPTVPFVPHDDL